MEETPMAAPKPWADCADLGLFTDLYELTMLQAYVERGIDETATFSLFVRRLPEPRNYLWPAASTTCSDTSRACASPARASITLPRSAASPTAFYNG